MRSSRLRAGGGVGKGGAAIQPKSVASAGSNLGHALAIETLAQWPEPMIRWTRWPGQLHVDLAGLGCPNAEVDATVVEHRCPQTLAYLHKTFGRLGAWFVRGHAGPSLGVRGARP